MPATAPIERPRLRPYRLLAGSAVAVLAAGTGSAPWDERILTAALYTALLAVSLGLQAWGESRPSLRRIWIASALLDLTASAFVVARIGPTTSSLLLLLSLPVLIWGLLRAIPGGLTVAAAAILADAFLIAVRLRPLAAAPDGLLWNRFDLAGPALATCVYHAVSLLLLGILAGLLGRSIRRQEETHRTTREELEQTRLDSETIVTHLSHALLCLDAEGRISRLNEGARRLLSAPEAAQAGRTLSDLAASPGLAELAAQLNSRLGCREELRSEVTLAGIPVEVTTTPVLDHQGNTRGLLVLLADLSERREREAEERRRERLAVIGELSAGLAHEIRNSLKPLTGSVELLRREIPPGRAGWDGLMEIILREAESLENFLSEFLSLARDKSLQMQTLPIERVLGEELAGLNAVPEGPFRLVPPDSGGTALWVRVDRSCLRQIVRNLGLNALEAAGAPVELGWCREGEEVEIFVQDHGPGIPEELQPRVFEPFFTTKPSGTGLGLAIARDLADRLGGRLLLRSQVGQGTRACIRLPLIAPPDESAAEPVPVRPAVQAA